MYLYTTQPALEADSITASIANWLNSVLSSLGISDNFLAISKLLILLTIACILIAILLFVTKKIIDFFFVRIYKITNIKLLDYMRINKLPYYLGLIVPYTFVRTTIPIILIDFQRLISPAIKMVEIYLVLMIIWAILALAKSFLNVLQERPAFANKPMHSYVQVIAIILYIFGGVFIIAILTGQKLGVVFGALGAASAVMMLIFQDSIKGFVGSVQMSTNNLVEIGDWITMNKYGADGNVEEVTLNSVKVRNFDKTITTIPTYALISDSFQNWKGMQESGGRRFKKCIHIKQSSIRFLSEKEIEKFVKVDYLSKLIEEKKTQYSSMDRSLINNALPITNNDLFMAYAMHYLKNHKKIAQDMTLLVRQLAPTTTGIPVEIYVFTATTVWAEYEGIATDIINHLTAIVPIFDLKVYELASDTDQLLN